MEGVVAFIIFAFFVWTVVLPIAALIARSRAKARVREVEAKLLESERRLSALAKGWRAIEWTGAWRTTVADVPKLPTRRPPIVIEAIAVPEEPKPLPLALPAIVAPPPAAAAPAPAQARPQAAKQ